MGMQIILQSLVLLSKIAQIKSYAAGLGGVLSHSNTLIVTVRM